MQKLLLSLQTIVSLHEVYAAIYGTDVNRAVLVKDTAQGYEVQTHTAALAAVPTAIFRPVATSAPATGLEIVSVTSPVAKGADASLVAQTSPGAGCSITVYYKSGSSQAAGLDQKKADASGVVAWSWKVGTRTTPGEWPIYVQCDTFTETTTFTVQ